MKNKGDINDYSEQKSKEIYETFLLVLARWEGGTGHGSIYDETAKQPTSRFFVSSKRAYKVISTMTKKGGVVTGLKTDSRTRMYREIYSRVCKLMRRNKNISLRTAVETVVRQPAPEMYLNRCKLRRIVKAKQKEEAERRKKYFIERQKRLGFCCTKLK